METVIDADLSSQLRAAINRLEAEEKKLSSLRSLLIAAQSQLARKNARIKELSGELETFIDRKEN